MASQRMRLQLSAMPQEQLRSRIEQLSADARVLQANKPRPIGKLYGARGPTPEQAERWRAESSTWNRAWRKNLDEHRLAIEISNENIRERRATEEPLIVRAASSMGAHAIERDVAEILLNEALL